MKREAPTTFRCPEELRNWVADQAARNERSFSAELVALLEEGRRSVTRVRETVLKDAGAGGVEGSAGQTARRGEPAAIGNPGQEVGLTAPAVRPEPILPSQRVFRPDFKDPPKEKKGRR